MIDRRMFLGYVAGPYRGKNSWEVEQNCRRAEELAAAVWEAGFTAICPHTNMRGYFEQFLPDEAWLAGDLVILSRCDFLILVPGWESSAGTLGEVEQAEAWGVPVFRTLVSLENAFDAGRMRKRVGFENPGGTPGPL